MTHIQTLNTPIWVYFDNKRRTFEDDVPVKKKKK